MKFKLCLAPLLALLVGCAAPARTTQAAPISLTPGVSIYVGAEQPEPIQRAARDLARDLARDCRSILGADSPIVNERAALNGQSYIEIVGPDDAAVRADAKPDITGTEAHGVFALDNRVVLQGTDMRGTIYAIYTFSEQFLGVKPLWFWASQPPLPQTSIAVPEGTDIRIGPPAVRWHTWFPNDTDLFSTWRKRSDTNYDALYETMLRLKLNCLESFSADQTSLQAPYGLTREVETARDRGLAFVGHHIHPVGADYKLWDNFWREIEHREPPALSVKNVEELKTFWRWHIELAQRNHLEEIWLIGFRGNGDRPFWSTFADSPTDDKERAALIERMMKIQVALVKEITGNPAPIMRTTLYNELSDFYAQGLLRPPVEPNLIWTFVAARRDHYPAPDAQKADVPPGQPVGYYMNFQFTSSGAHLVSAEGPWKMERNFRFINGIAPRPLEFSVVNMGNIREFLLEGSANAEMLWNFQSYDTDQFLAKFCQTYFGERAAPAIAALYRDFYDSYSQQRRPDLPGFERQYIFQDLRLSAATQRLISALKKGEVAPGTDLFGDGSSDTNGRYFNIVPADNGAANKLDALIMGTAQSIAKLTPLVARADALMATLPAQDQAFSTTICACRRTFC